jgi:AcrR family transcriptional regulator
VSTTTATPDPSAVGPVRPANTADPRYRRTRRQICVAVRGLLETTDPARITFAAVAAAAGVNRSTVHQHYATRHELIADALAVELAEIAGRLTDCPFTTSAIVPPQLVDSFSAAHDQKRRLSRLGDTDRCLLAERLSELLTEALQARFESGRPSGFESVPVSTHARYVAGGLARLLIFSEEAPDQLAAQAWSLIAPAGTP